MKRDGNIIPEIIDYGNMSESFDQVLRGTVRKTCREGVSCWLDVRRS